MTTPLKGYQRKYLRGLAHNIQPIVSIGQKGVTESVLSELDSTLLTHELIKVKFLTHKEKSDKIKLSDFISKSTNCEMVGMIGHIGIFFRSHPDPEKRKIQIPIK